MKQYRTTWDNRGDGMARMRLLQDAARLWQAQRAILSPAIPVAIVDDLSSLARWQNDR